MIKNKKCRFFTDISGNKIANIPYDEYISFCKVPENAFVCELSCENTGEENAAIIQRNIDKAYFSGGGTVAVLKGSYKISTVKLKSNVTLFLEKGAELISLSCDENEASAQPLEKGVIISENAYNIAVTGGGKINGMGLTYTKEAENPEPFYALESFNTYKRVVETRTRIHFARDTRRNHIFYFKNCKNIRLNNIILSDGAFWSVRFDNCFDVEIKDFIIDSHMHIANSDGIDICGGENYKISHCFVVTADDAVCIKSMDFPVKNVTVTDCILTSSANCFKIGTETQFDISDVMVSDCYFFMPDGLTYGYSGIAIESCDGANVKNISVRDIVMHGVSSPLLIWLGRRMKYDKKTVGSVENITVKNIYASDIEMPCAVVGCVRRFKPYRVRNVKIENLTASYRNTAENLNIRKRVGEYTMGGYPDIPRVSHIYYKSHEKSKYWDLPCYGMCVKHVKSLKLCGINITPRSCNKRMMYYLRDVN